ncbi:hypothetical protein CBL_20025 [Carabus blaptoides fortunei]
MESGKKIGTAMKNENNTTNRKESFEIDDGYQPINMEHLQPAFILLACGLILATMVFPVIRCPQITGARSGPEHYLPGTLCVRSTVSIPRCMMPERVKHRSQASNHSTLLSSPRPRGSSHLALKLLTVRGVHYQADLLPSSAINHIKIKSKQ